MKRRFEELPLYDKLTKKIFAYYSTIWQDRRSDGIHEKWLNNFQGVGEETTAKNKINALYLLSKFMYFGNIEMRELLKALYRDHVRYPIVKFHRQANSDTHDMNLLGGLFCKEMDATRFLGMGNPSESGVHLLYYFRQENELPKDLFINAHEIFAQKQIKEDIEEKERNILISELANPKIKRYIFIDDFCGSGTQAKQYSNRIVSDIKSQDSSIEVNYLMLFATENGLKSVKAETKFDRVEAIFTIDDTFKCFSENSRYYTNPIEDIDKDYSRLMCSEVGTRLWSNFPLGYKDGQLLLGLFHNTPDNTMPVFWGDTKTWFPIFKRYHKI